MVCSSFAGNSSGATGDFAVVENTCRDQFQRRLQRVLTDHRRGLSFRRLRRRCLAQFELQPPAVVADLRFAPAFERADLRQPRARASPGISRSSAFLPKRITALSGACMCRPRIARIELHHLPEPVFRPRQRAVQAETRPAGSRPVAARHYRSRCAAPSSAPRGTRHTAETCPRAPRPARYSTSAAARRAPARRCRSTARKSSTPRRAPPPDPDRRSRRSPDAVPYHLPTTSATRSRRISGMKKPPLNRIASGAWPVGSRNSFRWRVIAGSVT